MCEPFFAVAPCEECPDPEPGEKVCDQFDREYMSECEFNLVACQQPRQPLDLRRCPDQRTPTDEPTDASTDPMTDSETPTGEEPDPETTDTDTDEPTDELTDPDTNSETPTGEDPDPDTDSTEMPVGISNIAVFLNTESANGWNLLHIDIDTTQSVWLSSHLLELLKRHVSQQTLGIVLQNSHFAFGELEWKGTEQCAFF